MLNRESITHGAGKVTDESERAMQFLVATVGEPLGLILGLEMAQNGFELVIVGADKKINDGKPFDFAGKADINKLFEEGFFGDAQVEE